MESQSAGMSRRTLLAGGIAAMGGLLVRRLGGQGGPAAPEAPLTELRSFLTPNEHFFVPSHFETGHRRRR